MSNDHASPDRCPEATEDEVVVEKTFEVAGTPDQAWEKLTRLTAAHDPGPDTWWLPGFECKATEVAATTRQAQARAALRTVVRPHGLHRFGPG